jgi:aldehyde dehydrogenase (NAD+)
MSIKHCVWRWGFSKVCFNNYNNYDAAMPYGGYKMSGFGRESGMEAFEFYSQTKSVWVDLS